jgi:hypothetical protein
MNQNELDPRYKNNQGNPVTTGITNDGLLSSQDLGGGQSWQVYRPFTQKIVGGSQDIRKDLTGLTSNINSMATETDQVGQETTTVADPNAPYSLVDLQSKLASSGILTSDENQRVESAGTAEGSQWDSLIQEAEQKKRQGMAKSEIAAGEAGGFMNTQFAGQAALTPTVGGTWEGAGGELERIQSVYDSNISDLKSKKIMAINAAKDAARQAILTGKASDYNNAVKLYELAQKSNNEAQQLAIQKTQVLLSLRKDSREAQQFLSDLKTNELNQSKISQEIQQKAVDEIAPAIFSELGNDPKKNAEIISKYASQNKMDPSVISSAIISYKTAREKEQIMNSKEIADMLSKTRKGGKIDVPGIGKVEVVGEEQKAPTTLKAGGKVYQWSSGKWTDTGIKDSDFTPSLIIGALEKLQNDGALETYLREQGVNVPVSGTGSVSFRHNNPLNIKYGEFATKYGATMGQKSTDGGSFALFPDVQTGIRAAKDLLKGSSYSGLSLEKAMRRWSGGGYGADVAPELKGKSTGKMNDAELNLLVEKMKKREG